MKEQFYRNCIIEDRNSREFLNFNGEEWFVDFLKFAETLEERKEDSKFHIERIIKARELADNDEFRNNFSFSKEILNVLLSDYMFMDAFLRSYKHLKFGTCEEHNRREFPEVNLPIIRMMDYFLEQKAFWEFAYVMQKLEYEYIIIWFDLTNSKIDKIIKEDIYQPDLLYIFSYMAKEEFVKYFKFEYLPIMENASFAVLYQIVENSALYEECITHRCFLKAFKSFELEEQIQLIELMEEKEYDINLTKKLRELLNKTKTVYKKMLLNSNAMNRDELLSILEMSDTKRKKIHDIIEMSSYFLKYNVKDTDLWRVISLDENCIINVSHNYYPDIMNLYYKCRKYATKSIVKSLYPLNQISSKVMHLKDTQFNILARVGTTWEMTGLEDTFKKRTFCSFSILTEKNMSHYTNGVLYGYYTNVSMESIAHIFPIDSLSNARATTESELTKKINRLLDIDDLNQATFEAKTYNQLCIRTKDKDGKILWPDCIVCIDKVDEASRNVANELDLNIVVLHKNKDTIERNEDIYANLK